MKRILFLLFSLVAITSQAQVSLGGYIQPLNNSSYPVQIDSLGKGGYMVAKDTIERNAIPCLRRKYGMAVYAQSLQKLYILKDSNCVNTWVEFSGGSGVFDTVYTQSPIMSRTSDNGDSNIIYFNPDTANVWRGNGTGGVGGSGTINFVPKWSASTTLTNSQIFDSVNVGIGTTSPAYKLDVNGTGGFTSSITASSNGHRFGNLEINTSSNASITGQGIKVEAGDATFQLQGSPKAGGSMFTFAPYSKDTAKTNLTNSNTGIVKINGGFQNPNVPNLSGNVLWLSPSYDLKENAQTGTKIRGIYYDPANLGTINNATHIAFENTSGEIIHKNIATGSGNADQMVTVDSLGQLKKQAIPFGGGSPISYYLNGSVNQGTIGGIAYKEMSKTPVFGAGTDFTINADGYIQSFITDANDPSALEIPAGNWNFEMYFSATSNGGSPSFYVQLYKWDGTTLSFIASSATNPEVITNGTTIDLYTTALAVPQTILTATDRLVIRVFVTHDGKTITLHTEDSHLCEITTTFSTGITSLNGLTVPVQSFGVGTTGTEFGITSSGSSHTFNIPNASTSSVTRGLISNTQYNTFNGKQAAITGAATTITSSDLTVSRAIVSDASGKVATSAVTSTELGYVSGVTSGIQGQLTSKGYTLALTSISSALATATTYYFGNGGRTLATTADQSRVYIPKTGIIKKAYITSFSGTTGTITSITVSIKLNNATETIVATSTANSLFRTYINTSLSISVTEGDYIEMKVTSVSSVAPITNIFSGTLYIE